MKLGDPHAGSQCNEEKAVSNIPLVEESEGTEEAVENSEPPALTRRSKKGISVKPTPVTQVLKTFGQ